MAEISEDSLAPRELILPILDDFPQPAPDVSGALWMSNAKVYVTTGVGSYEVLH